MICSWRLASTFNDGSVPVTAEIGRVLPHLQGRFGLRALIVFLFSLGMPFAFHSACGNEGVCFAFSLASGICEWVQCIRDVANP